MPIFSFWRYLNLSSFFDHGEKRFDLKNEVDFKIYGMTTWSAKNYNTLGKIVWKVVEALKVENPNVEIRWATFAKKYISAKTYPDDISNITFKYLCENSPNSLYHFWNHKSFSTTQFLCIFYLKHYILSTKVVHQNANFQIFYCSS